jgi:cytochrome P450
MWKIEKEINSMILKVVKQRNEASYKKDLLQMILEGAKNYNDYYGPLTNSFCDNFIVDNCKNIYFACHETTAITASWSLMLLAAQPEWQARARAKVLEICGDSLPDANMPRNMKMVCIVLYNLYL